MDAPDWLKAFPVSPQNAPFYQRELAKVLGTLFSILGEYATVKHQQDQYYQRAEQYFSRCIGYIGAEGPSPLDYNNLADLYRQENKCDLAQTQMGIAFQLMGDKYDPAFYHTRAAILWKLDQPLKALLQLQQYTEADAENAQPQDIEQYIDNQIFAAKLAANVRHTARSSYIALSASLLEEARSFVKRKASLLGESTTNELLAKIEELLGFAYLELQGNEYGAADTFQHLLEIPGLTVSKATLWRWKLGCSKALTRLARSVRYRSSAQAAEPHWAAARQLLSGSAQSIGDFALSDDIALPRRAFNFRLRLDTVVALQSLAEESFRESRRDEAQTLTDDAHTILLTLRSSLEHDAPLKQFVGQNEFDELKSQMRFYEAQASYMLGRIAIAQDPTFADSGLIEKVRTNFDFARGTGSELDCRIDLEFGQMLLEVALALQGKGSDVLRRYDEAIASLERAVSASKNVPDLQTHALRALAEAYAIRPSLQQKAKTST
jgi:tetratricopeptide (TPR) repeat protein